MRWLWLQLIQFQCLWLIAILGQNDWLLLALLILLSHFIFTNTRRLDWRVLPLALFGIVMDTGLSMLGVFEFDQIPFWLALLWVGFVLSLGHSLYWLNHLPRLFLIPIGAIVGTLSYLAGWRLDAVSLPMGVMYSSLILAVSWAAILPLLVVLNANIRRPS